MDHLRNAIFDLVQHLPIHLAVRKLLFDFEDVLLQFFEAPLDVLDDAGVRFGAESLQTHTRYSGITM